MALHPYMWNIPTANKSVDALAPKLSPDGTYKILKSLTQPLFQSASRLCGSRRIGSFPEYAFFRNP